MLQSSAHPKYPIWLGCDSTYLAHIMKGITLHIGKTVMGLSQLEGLRDCQALQSICMTPGLALPASEYIRHSDSVPLATGEGRIRLLKRICL